ncbi:MAG: glycoside hydrolase family 113 [Promethearchaeota archaeon]
MHVRKGLVVSVLITLFTGVVATLAAGLLSVRYYPLPNSVPTYDSIPFQRGMSFTTWGAASFNSTRARQEVLAMKEVGVEWVGVNAWWYQENLTSTEIGPGQWTDTAANLSDAFGYIHSLGMKVMFKPMLDTKTGQWRSNIEASPDWFSAYQSFIWNQSELAQAAGVELFIIGCEMGNMQVHDAEVREMIAGVRERYSGLVSYAANHDSFWFVTWWDAVDLIGFDAWFPFTTSYDPTLDELTAVWDGFYDRLFQFSLKWNKPIFFPELGIQARDGSNMVPNDNKFNSNQDPHEMALWYRSLFASKLWTAPWFKGTYFWMWDLTDVDPLTETGFQPKLPATKDALDHAYHAGRDVVLPNYWWNLLLTLALGTALTAVSAGVVANRRGRSATAGVPRGGSAGQNDPWSFRTILGLSGGTMAFWATTFYNQGVFAGVYAAYTYSTFFGMDVTEIAVWLAVFVLASTIVAGASTNLFHRLSRGRGVLGNGNDSGGRLGLAFQVSLLVIGALTLTYVAILPATPIEQVTARTFLSVLLLGLWAAFVGSFFLLEHPDSDPRGRSRTYLAVALFAALSFSTLQLVLLYSPPLSVAACGLLTVSLTALTGVHFRHAQGSRPGKRVAEDSRNAPGQPNRPAIPAFPPYPATLPRDEPAWKERLLPSRTQSTGILLLLFGLALMIVLPRCFAPFTLINFHLVLIPRYYLPMALGAVVGVAFLQSYLGVRHEGGGKKPTVESVMLVSVPTFVALVGVEFFIPKVATYAGLVLGGFCLASWVFCLLLHEARLADSNCPPSRAARMFAYAAVFATVGFTANGISASFIYVFTFFTLVGGKLVVRTDFSASLGYDVPSLIRAIFSAVALVVALVVLAGFLVLYGRRPGKES